SRPAECPVPALRRRARCHCGPCQRRPCRCGTAAPYAIIRSPAHIVPTVPSASVPNTTTSWKMVWASHFPAASLRILSSTPAVLMKSVEMPPSRCSDDGVAGRQGGPVQAVSVSYSHLRQPHAGHAQGAGGRLKAMLHGLTPVWSYLHLCTRVAGG